MKTNQEIIDFCQAQIISNRLTYFQTSIHKEATECVALRRQEMDKKEAIIEIINFIKEGENEQNS